MEGRWGNLSFHFDCSHFCNSRSFFEFMIGDVLRLVLQQTFECVSFNLVGNFPALTLITLC